MKAEPIAPPENQEPQTALFRPRRFLIIDDHPIVRDALMRIVQSVTPDAWARGAGTLSEALRLMDTTEAIDLAILDLNLPDVQNFEALERLRQIRPECPVVIFSGEERPDIVLRAIELGACGYFPKSLTSDELLEALELVRRGHIYVPARVMRSPIRAVTRGGGAAATASVRDGLPAELSDRQKAILSLLLLGYPNKVIARRLGLAVSTVKNHVSAVLRSLGVKTRAEAIFKLSGSRATGAGQQ